MADHKHILVVEDERDLVDLLTFNLRKSGYRTSVASNGRQAVDLAGSAKPDLILLDLMLPELSGTEVAGRIRTNPVTSSIPIIMLTAKTGEVDQIVGLSVGADDYVPKPFSMKVLMARIEAVLRRSSKTNGESSQSLRLGPVELDTTTHEVLLDGKPIKLTLTEFRLLASLLQAAGRVLSRGDLMSRAMGPGVMVTERTIDVHITSIRKKLATHGGMVRTVRGVGYRATLEPETGSAEETGP